MEYTVYEYQTARQPSRSMGDHIYISRMARSLVGSLGTDGATACVNQHHWEGLRPLVMAQDSVICG